MTERNSLTPLDSDPNVSASLSEPVEVSGDAAANQSKASQHRAAKRALEVIEFIAESEDPLSLSELAHRAQLPKSTAHSLVHTLTAEGFLERGAHSGKYALGPRLLRLLGRLPDQFELPRIARPIMQRLVDEMGETALIGIRRANRVLYVEQVEAPQFIRYVAPLGEPRPLHCTSIGKLFVAFLPEDEVRAMLAENPPDAITAYTKTNIQEILAEARAVKEQGFALNREESISGVTAIAAPIYPGGAGAGRLIGGLSLVGPSDRMAPKLQQAKELVIEAGAQIALAIKSR
jgi:DNA-binding IclR family transcriptional regulator